MLASRQRTVVGGLILAATCTASGCGGQSTPASPSPVLPAAPGPAPGQQLAGWVTDSAFRPLAGATVDVVSGANAGLSTTTDGAGSYRLSGTFDGNSRFRASMAGHVAVTRPLPEPCEQCGSNLRLSFTLEPDGPRLSLAGRYTVTFVAAESCPGWPEDLRARSYDAEVRLSSRPGLPPNSTFDVTLGGRFLERFSWFSIGVARNYVASYIGDWGHGLAGLIEDAGGGSFVAIGGDFDGTITDPGSFSMPLRGTIDRCESTTPWGSRERCGQGDAVMVAHCTSDLHQIRFTRR